MHEFGKLGPVSQVEEHWPRTLTFLIPVQVTTGYFSFGFFSKVRKVFSSALKVKSGSHLQSNKPSPHAHPNKIMLCT